MLREPPPDSMGASVFTVATCCHTIMCIDHPFYDGKFAMVIADVCNLNTGDCLVKFQTNQESYDEKVRGPILKNAEKDYELKGNFMEHMGTFMETTG